MKTLVLSLRNNLKKVGSVNYGFHRKMGFISNIIVNKNERRNGIGTELLKLSENNLKNIYKVEEIKLCAWNSIYSNSSNLDFYIKNGYKINGKTTYYDNESDIFEITGFIKKLHVIVE
jgi:ribosomal protein S18 acetylase RimI-like enzyme